GPSVPVSQIGQQRDRALVDRVQGSAVVPEAARPPRAGTPGRCLGDEATIRVAGDLGVALEVAAQPATTVWCLEPHERRERRKVDSLLEDQRGLQAAVGE